jgi:hypothetical protein
MTGSSGKTARVLRDKVAGTLPHLLVFMIRSKRANSGGQIVAVMQAADSRKGYDPTTCIGILRCGTARRCSLLQREMRSIFMVVADVFIYQPF